MTKARGLSQLASSVASGGVAILCLVSGEQVRIEGPDATIVRQVTQAFADAGVKWLRVGERGSIDLELTREARHTPPDVLVLISARDWLATIASARAHFSGTPILAVSASSSSELEALRAGADSFCAFPADFGLLEARLRAVLRLRRSGIFPVSGAQAIALDASSRTLLVSGAAVQLSPAEYVLVELLLERQDEWVPKAALWKALARESGGRDSSLLRMHAMQVRKKLGDERWMLQSQRGKGMMLTTRPVYNPLARRSS